MLTAMTCNCLDSSVSYRIDGRCWPNAVMAMSNVSAPPRPGVATSVASTFGCPSGSA